MDDIKKLILDAQKEIDPELQLKQFMLIDKRLDQIMTCSKTPYKDLQEAKNMIHLLALSKN